MSTSMYESPIDIMGPHTTNAGTEDVGGYEVTFLALPVHILSYSLLLLITSS